MVAENAYVRDLLNQPEALRHTLQGLERSGALQSIADRLQRGEFRQIVLTGMGSSLYALHPLLLELVGRGWLASMVETSELAHYLTRALAPETLLIVVSQSGRSAEILRLLERNARRAVVVGVTNTPASPLAEASDAVVMTRAGSESTVACKTYVASLVVLGWLGGVLTGNDRRELLEAAPGAAASYLEGWEEHVRDARDQMAGVKHLFLAGRGTSLAAAGCGGLIIKEAAHFHAEGMSSAAFRHGPLEMAGSGLFLLVFAGDARTAELNERLAADVTAAGGRAAVVSDRAPAGVFRIPAHPAEIRPILEILPVQMITLALAALTGREPGAFSRATKVTAVE